MSNRSVLILLAVALSLAIVVLLFEREVSQQVESSPDEYKVFKAYSKDQVQWVSLSAGEMAVQLERQPEGWQLLSPVQAEADPQKVDKLLSELGEFMEVGIPIKAKPGGQIDFAEYGLANPSRRIIVSYGGVEEATLSLGNRTEKEDQVYARQGNENRVMIVGSQAVRLLDDAAGDRNYYRSRRIFQEKHIDKALEIQIAMGQAGSENPTVLKRNERTDNAQQSAGWMLTAPQQDRADPEAVKNLLAKCAELRVTEFVDLPTDKEELAKRLTAYGLIGPGRMGYVGVAAEELQTVILHIGRLDEQGKNRWAVVDRTAVLAGSQELVKIPAEFAEDFAKSVPDLRDRKFLRFDKEGVSQITIASPDGEVVLDREKPSQQEQTEKTENPAVKQATGGWLVKFNQNEKPAERGVVESFCGNLQELTAGAFDGAAKPEMDFEHPYISIKLSSDRKGQGGTLEIGAATADSKYRYARLRGDTSIRILELDKAEALVHGELYFHQRKIAELSKWEIKEFEISSVGGQKKQGIYKEGQWWLGEPVKVRAENDVVGDTLSIFDPLKAQEVVADGVSDGDAEKLKPYGLDEAQIRLRVVKKIQETTSEPGVEGKAETKPEEYVLLVGKAAGTGDQSGYYARLQGRDLVFTLEKTAVDKLDDDLRSRKVLPLEKWQTRQLLKVEISRGPEVLSLDKSTGNWQMVSPKKFWPNQDAVEELLESMVDLGSTEFGEDPSSKEYGLANPVMTVSLTEDQPATKQVKTYRFSVGGPLKDKRQAIRTEGEDVARLVAAEKLEKLQQSYLAYRKKQVLNLEGQEIGQVEVICAGRKTCLAQHDGRSWKLTEPQSAALEVGNLERILQSMSNLQAMKMVTDDPQAADKYGLNKPVLTIGVTAAAQGAEQQNYRLLIGAEAKNETGVEVSDKKKPPHYAMLEGDPTVFVLSGNDVETLQADLAFEPK